VERAIRPLTPLQAWVLFVLFKKSWRHERKGFTYRELIAHPFLQSFQGKSDAPRSLPMLRKTMGQLRKRSLITSYTDASAFSNIRVGARPEVFTLDPSHILNNEEIAAYLVIIDRQCTTIPTTVGESKHHISQILKLKEYNMPVFRSNLQTAAKLGYVTFSNLEDDQSELQLTAKTYSELPYLLLLYMQATAITRP